MLHQGYRHSGQEQATLARAIAEASAAIDDQVAGLRVDVYRLDGREPPVVEHLACDRPDVVAVLSNVSNEGRLLLFRGFLEVVDCRRQPNGLIKCVDE
ncbi:hypothetical protein D3C71_1567400 [compost metagenome]